MSPAAGLLWMGFTSIAIILVCRWVAGIRDEVSVLKKRVGNLHHALEIQLEYNRAVDNHIGRLEDDPCGRRPSLRLTKGQR